MKKIFAFLLVLMISASCGSSTPAVNPAPPASAVITGEADSASPATTSGSVDSTPQAFLVLREIPLEAGYGVVAGDGWLELYFTNPQSPLASQKTGGVDIPLAAAIDNARLSVDVAVYSLSLNSIRDALIRAYKRGVRVRMVMESENLDRTDPQKLKDASIPVLGDRREGLMHNKFAVIDNSEVWLGSMNFTDSGAYTDNNNLVHIRSVKMAENFTKEFEEMFVNDKFGPDMVAETPYPKLEINGVPVEVYFSPDDGVQASLVSLLGGAQESINFMAFSFTADPIGEAIRNRAQDKVVVEGVMETDQVNSNAGTEFDPFQQAGLDVLRDGNEGQMHHKVIIVDEKIVVLGSYNFTNSAETRNDETLVIIHNEEIARQFMLEFERVRSQAVE